MFEQENSVINEAFSFLLNPELENLYKVAFNDYVASEHLFHFMKFKITKNVILSHFKPIFLENLT